MSEILSIAHGVRCREVWGIWDATSTSQLAELLHRYYQTTEAIAFLTNSMIFMPLVS